MEHTDSLDTIANLGPGHHVCWLYETEEEHRAVLTPFLRQGLERGEKVLYIMDAHGAETVLGYLQDDGLDVEPYLARQQLTIVTSQSAYMQQDVFDPDEMIAFLRAETERALAEGHTALRATGEMSWALGRLPRSERLMEYEAKLNEFFPGSDCLGMCQYDRRAFSPALLLDVLCTHPVAVIGTDVYDNPYYVPPAGFLGDDPPAEVLRHWLEHLAERKRGEETLRQSEARYRLLAENATDIIWTMDTNLRFTYVSPSVTRLRGYTVEEAMAQTLAETLTPASLEVAMKAVAEEWAIEKMEDKDLARWRTLEVENTCKDGSTVWFEVKVAFLHDEHKRPVGIVGVSRDISKRKRAEEALRESEQRFRTLSGATFEGVVIRKKGRILDANQTFAKIFGYDLSEVIGMDALDFAAPESRDFVRQSIISGSEKPFEAIGLRKDGSTFPGEVCGKAIPYRGRMVTVAAIRDITDRKRAEEALQKAREDIEGRVEGRMQQVNGYGLTFRELTVLHLVTAGESDKEIATVLGISPLTAHKHLANILEKMGAACRTEAGVRALREGLLD
jgi:PAS domain S-box-containing protein